MAIHKAVQKNVAVIYRTLGIQQYTFKL